MSASPDQIKFTEENVTKILSAIRRGVPYKIAAEAHKVADSTFYKWISQGMKDIEKGFDSKHADLVESLRTIEMKRISKNIATIRNSEKGHRGKEWELERSFWKYFSAHTQNIELNLRVEELEKIKE